MTRHHKHDSLTEDSINLLIEHGLAEGQGYVLDASLAYHISPDNRTQVRLSWKDADGRSLGAEHPFRCPTGDSAGSRRIVLPLQAPDGSSYAALALSRFAPVRG
jgi:hypothetical protein